MSQNPLTPTNLSSEVKSWTEQVEELKEELAAAGAMLKGHFILTSGRHSDTYIEKFRLLERPDLVKKAVRLMIADIRELNANYDVVMGPTTGGVIVAYETGAQLGIPAIYAEREEGKRVLKRGASISPGTRVLLVDDVLTTGLSIREMAELVESYGGTVETIATLIDRSESNIKVPTFRGSAIRIFAKSYAPDEVPDWLREIPTQKPGTR